MKKIFFIKERIALMAVSCAVLIFAGCAKNTDQPLSNSDQAQPTNSISEQGQQSSPNFVPNELLVKFKAGSSKTTKGNALGKINGNIGQTILTEAMKRSGDNEGFVIVHTPLAVLDAIGKMKGLPDIVYAEPNYIYQHDAVSNDTYFTNGSLWGMYGPSTTPSNQYGSQAASAWAVGHTGSSSVYVGLIDEGAMYNHVDLAGNFGNPLEIAGNGVDDDGNGKVDDVYGWDFVSNDNSTYDGSQDDHGTHVSGTIGGKGGNGIGVAGINWNVKIISAKFLGPNGGTTANAILAVDYITNLKTHDGLNIVATNNSWGGGGYSQGLYDAIERANSAGILFIAAAGNGNQGGRAINIDSKPSYPASYTNSNIIAVAAIDNAGNKASWSNYGATSVDLGAPGVGIYSTLPGNTYGSYSGTSMATPHVTGGAALYASTHPGATAAQIKAAILGSVVPTASLSGKTVTGGRLNVSGF
jgi:subtilisin family serine protease